MAAPHAEKVRDSKKWTRCQSPAESCRVDGVKVIPSGVPIRPKDVTVTDFKRVESLAIGAPRSGQHSETKCDPVLCDRQGVGLIKTNRKLAKTEFEDMRTRRSSGSNRPDQILPITSHGINNW